MYIFKNAWKNVTRNKGKNILIGIIIVIVTISSYISLAVNMSSNNLVESYKNSNPLEVTLSVNMRNLRENKDNNSNIQIESLSIDDVNNYGNSDYVKDYYYYYNISLSSEDITAVSMDDYFKKPEGEDAPSDMPDRGNEKMINDGDFRFSAYSDITYAEAFINGTNKISDGEMFDNDNEENVIVISSDLASENELSVDDTVIFYVDSTDETIEFKIIGIYYDSSDNSDNFMNMNAMMSSNQIYTTLSGMEEILELKDSINNSLNAKFYLNSADDLENYSDELREKGLSEYYSINDNMDTILSTLEPIQNISNFSITFLIVIIVVALIVIGILTMINIRDRKYEIGVLRAIGMSKIKVMMQLLIEIIIVTIIAIIIGICTGKVLSQPVTNVMLKQEIEKYQKEQNEIKDNFGGKEFEHGDFGIQKPGEMTNSENFVDSLTVEIEPITIIQVTGISLLIAILCGTISIIYVNRYSPNKILQNRG